MTDLVDDQTTMKLLAYTFLSGINYTNMYLNSNGSEHIKKLYRWLFRSCQKISSFQF